MTSDGDKRERDEALKACTRALRLVCLSLPYLSGLVQKVRVHAEPRVGTAGVFASGRMAVNPKFVLSLKPSELVFILAHEVLHLALDTHGRGAGSPPQAVNVAHDYIINDILANELGQEIPADGLTYEGARQYSLEDLLSQGINWQGKSCWRSLEGKPGLTTMGEALAEAGLVERLQHAAPPPMIQDVLSAQQERQWYPDVSRNEIDRRYREIQSEAAKANSLQILKDQLERESQRQEGDDDGVLSETVEALKTSYRPPWQLAMQRWFDATAPTERSYARPSRRGLAGSDIVLPGRKREGRTMHIVLDTSGSMTSDLGEALGIIGAFCEDNFVSVVHILQCDIEITVDEWVRPEDLETYEIRGLGGSDMSPGMQRLADDPDVEAAIVITDGFIEHPQDSPPYEVLWAVIDIWDFDFDPPYGIVVPVPMD